MIIVVGSLNIDFVGHAPRVPAAGETVLGDALACHHGGKGGNQAVAAARLGARVAFIGAVGDDTHGESLVAALADEGVDVAGVARVPGASGAALITVDAGGDNAITVLPGANRAVPAPAGAWPAAARLLVLQLEVPLAVNLAWARRAHEAGAAVVLNAAPGAPLPPALLQRLDTLIVNRSELAMLSPGSDVTTGLQALAAQGPPRVVVTLGDQGCAGLEAGVLHTLPAHPVAVADSTGAGDAFVGAYAAARAADAGFEAALRQANAGAALACTRPGARAGMPCAGDLAALGAA